MTDAYNTISDDELIAHCRRGQADAFTPLVERYQDRMFNTVLRLVYNYDDALEITQDAFVRAFRNIKRFRGQSSFYTWLYRIGVNLCLNHRRRKEKITFYSPDASAGFERGQAAGLAELAQATDPGPQQKAQLQENYHRVLTALETLEPDARAVVVLRDIEQLSYAEIGQVLEIPLGTVKSRLGRARLALREHLQE